jgi:hypothetical protein
MCIRPFGARRRLGKHVLAATNVLFSVEFMSYQRKLGDLFFPEHLVFRYKRTLEDNIKMCLGEKLYGFVNFIVVAKTFCAQGSLEGYAVIM